MDVNSALLQIPSPASASSSEETASRPLPGRAPSNGGAKKSFASVLRTAQQDEHKALSERSDDAGRRQVGKSGPETEQGKGAEQKTYAGDDAPRSGKTEGRGLDAETEQLPQNHIAQSEGLESRSQDTRALMTNVPVELARVLGQVTPSQGAPVISSFLSEEDAGQGPIEELLLQSSQNNGERGVLNAPVVVAGELGESITATTEETDQAPVRPQGETVPMGKPSLAVPATQPMWEASEAPSGQTLDPMVEPVVKAGDQKTGEQSGTPTQGHYEEGPAVAVQPTTERGTQVSQVSQELSRLGAAGPQLTRLIEQPVQQKQADASTHPLRDLHSLLAPPDAEGEDQAGKSMAIAPHGMQAGSDSGQTSDLRWSNQDGRHAGSGKDSWLSHAPIAPSQSEPPGDHSGQLVTAGNLATPQPQPVDSRPALHASSVSSVAPAQHIEPFVPTLSRSVAFEIAEPDLGRINIRVAMSNELVHAYLSSDRSEVGQFLINGQDRLQSALQSNGLEMGQFRVDIDRQSAGRSFQQGPSQDQSRMWQQASNGAPNDVGGFARHDETSLSYTGRLNLVA